MAFTFMYHLQYILYPASLIISGIGAYTVQHYGFKFGVLDKPTYRSSHHKITPKGGGIGIVASFVFSSILLQIPISLWFPTTVVAIFSLYGDKRDISPKTRLLVQFALCFIFLFGHFTSYPEMFGEYLLFIPFSVFIVGTANYYNFMDGINGIASITGMIAFAFLSYYALISDLPPAYMVLNLCLSLACLGFLPFNMPNAKVFMGDVGSIFLGFVYASFVVMFTTSFLDFLCLISFLFPFYADELTTLAVRIRDGDSLILPHRKHTYQLLANELTIAHWKVSSGYGVMQIIVGIVFLFLRPYGVIPMILTLAIFFLLFAIFSYAVRKKITLSIQSQSLQNY